MASIKYKDNGTYKDIVVKVGDTLPIGAIIGFDTTQTIPDGWEYYAENQIKKIAPVTPASGLLKNTYGISKTDGYAQEYINNTTKKITTSTATVDTTYISNTEQNLITRVGQLVQFDFIFKTTGTWTATTKFFTGLPKPNTTTKIRFVALKTNPEVPLRFQLNADGSIQNGWSNVTISSGQIIEGHITYITTE